MKRKTEPNAKEIERIAAEKLRAMGAKKEMRGGTPVTSVPAQTPEESAREYEEIMRKIPRRPRDARTREEERRTLH